MSGGRVSGRRILITGAASGIGRESAALCAREGAKVALFDRDVAALGSFAPEVSGVACPGDVSDESSVEEAVSRAAREMGGIDGLVNAAGISSGRGMDDTDLALWTRTLAVNLTGTFLVCRAASLWLRKARGASIVNIASSLALVPVISDPAYMASKGGVISLSRALAADFAPDVRVNVIAPGAVETPLLIRTVGPEQLQKMPALYPLKRIGQPSEIAQAILFLISSESSFITGTTIAVDGGRSFH